MDVRHLPAKDVYGYALTLLDVMFTKDEQARSLIYASSKSSKPGLPGDRVRRFFRELHQLCLEMGRHIVEEHIVEEEKLCPKVIGFNIKWAWMYWLNSKLHGIDRVLGEKNNNTLNIFPLAVACCLCFDLVKCLLIQG